MDILIINFHIESLFTCSIFILAGSRNQSFLFLKSFCHQRIMGNRQNSWRTKRLKCSRGQMKRKRVGGGQQMSRYWITCYHLKKKWQLSTPNIFGRHIFLWLPSSSSHTECLVGDAVLFILRSTAAKNTCTIQTSFQSICSISDPNYHKTLSTHITKRSETYLNQFLFNNKSLLLAQVVIILTKSFLLLLKIH